MERVSPRCWCQSVSDDRHHSQFCYLRTWDIGICACGASTLDWGMKMTKHSEIGDGRFVRSRWAAIGAAVAVSLGGGGLLIADAAGGSESSTVAVDPVRILDTRDPVNVGLSGPFVSAVSQKLQVTGVVSTVTGSQTVVPPGATGVLLNVTATGTTASGFISIRPGNASGTPTTSSLNVNAGVTVPNAVTVALPTSGPNAGMIDITFDAYGVVGPITEILIDVVGYTTDGRLNALQAQIDAILLGTALVPAGQTVIGFGTWDHSVVITNEDIVHAVFLPALERIVFTFTDVNFAPSAAATDDDASCTGTYVAPTAPSGKVCIYISSSAGMGSLQGTAVSGVLVGGSFWISGVATGAAGNDLYVQYSWAYHAP